ncbi:MAG: 4'-phosphopantetheinyl transferase superfamily protein [Clostridiales bacterium]|nr:4'-phosphopantetheinyl transferase superfamily protein [Clostridiales bacterium]
MIKTYIVNIRQFDDVAVYKEMLEGISPFRLGKIDKIKNESDKKRSLGAAVALDRALSGYGLREGTMEYGLGEKGKPFFKDYPEIYFSISHSKDYAICSIGDVEVGSDIEWVRDGKKNVAKRFFAEEELKWIEGAVNDVDRDKRLFQIWTMKESFLKVTGLGMSLSLKDFAVIIGSDNKKNGEISLRQKVNDKVYYIKEYAMPKVFNEQTEYKIAVCSTGVEFAKGLEIVII